MHFNAFIRHAKSVQMASIAQIVNVIAPIFTRKDSLVLQTIFYPFEIYSSTCGLTALDVRQTGDTFTGGKYRGVPTLDVSAALDQTGKQLVLCVVNRNPHKVMEARIDLTNGRFSDKARVRTINRQDIKVENTLAKTDNIQSKVRTLSVGGQSIVFEFEPHSVTALVYNISRKNMRKKAAGIQIPYGHERVTLNVAPEHLKAVLEPETQSVKVVQTEQEIVRQALAAPIESKRLADLAAKSRRVLLITSDHTRPLPSAITLPLFLEEIRRNNPDVRIKILVATGFHRLTTT